MGFLSHNMKGVAPLVPPVQCWADKNQMSGLGEGETVAQLLWARTGRTRGPPTPIGQMGGPRLR